jgi:tRNA (adenine22-N1)-methyltransferase
MIPSLSTRLLACAGFVNQGDRVADIGCDHGYLSIHLLTNGIASFCIASDVAEGPLQSAMHNARKFGVHENISFYLSDGVRNIPRDFDTLVCAGMGGDTMIHILESAPWLRDEKYRLILQCQSKTPMLRKYISENGWYINREVALRDGKFLYTVMEVIWKPFYPMSTGAWYFSEAMQEQPSPEAPAYYRWVKGGLEKMVTSRGENANPELVEALAELESLLHNPNLSWLKEEHL